MILFCDRCGFELRHGRYTYSQITRRHYCSSLSDCERKLRGELTLDEAAEQGVRLLARIAHYGWETLE